MGEESLLPAQGFVRDPATAYSSPHTPKEPAFQAKNRGLVVFAAPRAGFCPGLEAPGCGAANGSISALPVSRL